MPWRPQHPDDFPSLGWLLLEWLAEFLPSPRDETSPLLFTDEQARGLVEWWRLHPVTGQRVYRRGYARRSKGYGKSPVEASKSIAEFAGPVRFAGWDANGQPVGMPWGTKDAPQAWVQIAALSEDQTDNTWSVVHSMLTGNDGRSADLLRIDAGITRCFLRDQPGAKLEPVSSSAGSREGQPITYGVLDESHLMVPSNGGVRMARTIRRNVAKMGGHTFETTNAYLVGQDSVAEASHRDVLAGSPGIYADEVEAPREIDGRPLGPDSSDADLLAALDVAYGDSWWVDRERLLADARDPSTPWADVQRFNLNWPIDDEDARPIPASAWESLHADRSDIVSGETFALDVSPDRKWSSFAVAGRCADGVVQVEVFDRRPGTSHVVDRAVELWTKHHKPIRIEKGGPAGSFVSLLVERGVDVVEVSTVDHARATGQFIDAAMSGRLRHLGDPALRTAVAGATLRHTGDADLWGRRNSKADITPLVACTLALGGVPEPAKNEFFII